MFFTIRKTYGYLKKMDKISIGQYEKGCNLPRRTVVRTLKKLVTQRTLSKNTNSYISAYGIQKNYDLWVGTPVTLGTFGAKTRDKTIPKLGTPVSPTKETKETKERKLIKLKELREKLIERKVIC